MKTIICPCGKEIPISPSEVGRAKYCSKKCFYIYRKRPSGLSYKIVAKNKGWFLKGKKPWNKGISVRLSPETEFKKGEHNSPKTEFNAERVKGDKNFKWKGEEIGYFGIHTWIQRYYGKANHCENEEDGRLEFECNHKSKNYDWALIKGKDYKRKRENFMQLCHSCHLKYDKQ